jgi:hypothetical protein
MRLTAILTPARALVTTALLSFLAVIHADEKRVVGIKDGLELIVSTVAVPDHPLPLIECRLHNTTDQDIPFDSSTPTHRLTFQLYDASGADLPMDPEWKRLNAYDEAGFARRHASSAVKPGKDRIFSFRPDLAYGERWKQAARLVVNWEPGIDWAWPQKPYTKGRGLKVNYEIPKDGVTPTLDEQSKGSAASEPSPGGSQDIDLMKAKKKLGSPRVEDPLNVEQPSTTSWSILVILAVGVLAVVWFMFKKRSSAKN